MDRKRRVHTLISSAAIAAAVFASVLPAQAQIGGFGTSSAGGSGGTPDRTDQFHRDLRAEFLRQLGRLLDRPDEFQHVRFRPEHRRWLGRARDGSDQSVPASVRRPGADQQQHARIWRRSNLPATRLASQTSWCPRARPARNQVRPARAADLAHQLAHGAIEAFQRERIHAPGQELTHHADRLRVVPLVLRDRIEPHAGRIGARSRARARLRPAPRSCARPSRPASRSRRATSTHRRRRSPCSRAGYVCSTSQVGVVSIVAAAVLLPHPLVEAVVEVVMLHVLELGARRREQLLGRLHVPVHRAADVEEQQHLHRIVPLGPHDGCRDSPCARCL